MPSKMKVYESFDAWKKAQKASAQLLIRALRKLVNDCGLPLEETVKWGNGAWTKKDLAILYIHVLSRGVQLGFFAGSKVADPKEVLEGKGKFVRFITIRSKTDIDAKYFTALIKKASKIKYR